MDYELAKQLKEAGFPEGALLSRTYIQEVYIPTLSELIEACGNGFNNVGRYRGEKTDSKYVCNYTGNNVNDNEDRWESEGETLEESVAKLYLKLKKDAK